MTKTSVSKQGYPTRADARRVVTRLEPIFTDPKPEYHTALGIVKRGRWHHVTFTRQVGSAWEAGSPSTSRQVWR